MNAEEEDEDGGEGTPAVPLPTSPCPLPAIPSPCPAPFPSCPMGEARMGFSKVNTLVLIEDEEEGEGATAAFAGETRPLIGESPIPAALSRPPPLLSAPPPPLLSFLGVIKKVLVISDAAAAAVAVAVAEGGNETPRPIACRGAAGDRTSVRGGEEGEEGAEDECRWEEEGDMLMPVVVVAVVVVVVVVGLLAISRSLKGLEEDRLNAIMTRFTRQWDEIKPYQTDIIKPDQSTKDKGKSGEGDCARRKRRMQ